MGSTKRTRATRTLLLLGLLLVVGASVARFVHLEADFPVQLTRSGAPLSDEGWHSSAATRYWLFGYWYLPGDVNRAVMQPTFQILQWMVFGVLGVGLTASRLMPVLLFLGLVALTAGTIRRQAGLTGALMAGALLSTDFHLFAYSRIALIDLPMLFFVIASLCLLLTLGAKRPLLGGVLAGLACSWALLTKPTALFAVPVLLLVAALGEASGKLEFRRGLAFLGSTILSTGLHYALGFVFFPQDMPAFWSLMASKVDQGGTSYLARAWTAIRIMGGRDLLLCMALIIAFAFLLQQWKRQGPTGQRVSIFYLLGTVCSFVVIASTHYQPVRYFVPFIALAIGVVSIATASAISGRRHAIAAVLVLLVALHIGLGAYRIVDYLGHPKWSYRDFCEKLKADLSVEGSRILVMGDMAPQVSIATGLESLSGLVGARPAAWRFHEYHPTHLLTRSPFTELLIEAVSATERPVLIETYSVMGDYYEGPVHLHRVVPAVD